MSGDLGSWAAFFAAETGAAAALAGLLVVALSINLARILEHPHLPGRAAETLVLLMGALLACSLALLPGQPIWALGTEVMLIGVVSATLPLIQQAQAVKSSGEPMPHLWARMAITYLPVAPFLIGGPVMMAGSAAGLYLLAVGVLLAFIASMLNAWVLLVEILR